MRRTVAILAAATIIVTAPAALLAADDAKPNTLTPKEISDGWILLYDGQTPFGWTADEAKPATADGIMKLGPGSLQTTSEFCSFELAFQYGNSGKPAHLVLGAQKQELPDSGEDKWTQAAVRCETKGKNRVMHLGFAPVGKKPGQDRESTENDNVARIAIGFSVPADAGLQLRDVKLKPLAMKSLFNGKDLKGWKIIPDQKSKFSVTDKGELNIKNGGGEIQTEGQWADFILQLDVFSNGKSLNSGIFFRALPGQFWQGYEAQIRNEWDGYSPDAERAKRKEDRTKPHDIGTGGIYNRQASRKVVSNDKEWFTYTVLANGKHIACWVNGYQTADYVDNDEDADTARKGRFLGKGAIGLQGHDPTTDLSFRKISVQELPPKK